MRGLTHLLSLLFLLSVARSRAAVNILTNGSFEIPANSTTNVFDLRYNSTILIGWFYNKKADQAGGSSVNGYIPTDYSSYPGQFSTPFGARWVVFGGGSANPGGEMIQTKFLDAGLYKASICAKGYGYSSEYVQFALGIFPNVDLGGAEVNGDITRIDRPEFGVWNQYETYFRVDVPGYVDFIIADATNWGSATNADLYVDNAVLELIPEPSAYSLLAVGLGGLAMMSRRQS